MSQRSFLKDISGVFGSNLLALVNAFLIDIILSRQLGPEGRGLYTSILVVPLIVVSFALLGIRRSAVYHLGQKVFNENRTVSGVLSLLVISSILAILISGLALIFMKPEGLTWPMAVITLLSIPVKLILIYSGGIYIGKEEFKRSNLQVWLPLFYNLIGIFLFVVLIKWSVFGALFSLFISNLLVSIASISYLNRNYRIKLRFDKEVIGSLARLGIAYALAVVVMQLNYRVDLLLLQKLSTLKEVGYYSLGVSISDKLWQLPSAIGLVVMSRSANTTDEFKLNRDVARLLPAMVDQSLPVAAFVREPVHSQYHYCEMDVTGYSYVRCRAYPHRKVCRQRAAGHSHQHIRPGAHRECIAQSVMDPILWRSWSCLGKQCELYSRRHSAFDRVFRKNANIPG
jgi:O-antigen/teichoic acid export membrane protein